ncbi:MAG: outer membrane protein [Methylocystis sp.]|uniref:outer membrane protein n=1 Tax=Methylocystis sp. TaxID=1911079 RepID=UPI003DA351D7
MKKVALTVAALALTAGSALAADLPSRKAPPMLPPPPPPPPMWTGFYVGLNAGGTWANSNHQTIAVAPVAFGNSFNPWIGSARFNGEVAALSSAASAGGFNGGNNGGFIGGGQIGYNWQFYNSFVAGVEADIQGLTGNSGSRSFITAAPTGFGDSWIGVHSVRGNLDYLGTVRGRLGWLFTPTLLVYGTGGLAYGGVTLNTASTVYNDTFSNFIAPAFGGVNFSNTQVGWTAGGGLEWMFWPNWSAKVEYLYYDLGTVTQNFAMPISVAGGFNDSALFAGQARARVNGNIVRAGVNYHFNWGAPAPVVAKY